MSWIKSVALTRTADYLFANGLEPADVANRLQLPLSALLDDNLWIDRDHVFGLTTDIAAITSNACFGLHIREMGDLRMYGRWGEGIIRAPHLAGALRYAAENIDLIETGRRLSMHCLEDGRVRFQSEFVGPVTADPHHLDQATALSLKRLTDRTLENVTVEVHLPLARPTNTDEFERLLGPHLVFDAKRAAVVFDRDALSLPLRMPLPDNAAGTKTHTPAHIVRDVVRAMQAIIRVERPSALEVASSLGITLRTMQRNLRLWGTTFEELLTEFLMLRAAHELRRERCTVTDVAFILGYSDSGHFTRAFKRWAGCTPRDFRSRNDVDLPMLRVSMLEEPAQGGLTGFGNLCC